jgi:hypothetical protein
MLRTSELDMAKTITPVDVNVFLDNVAWAICSTYHTGLKASPGAAIFGRNILFDIPFIADWNKIGDYRQRKTDLSTARKNSKQVNYDYKHGDKVLLTQKGNSERQIIDLAKLILSADQINLCFIQLFVFIWQFRGTY